MTNAVYHQVILNGVPVTNSNQNNAPATLNKRLSAAGAPGGRHQQRQSENSADVSLTKSKSGQAVTSANFKNDVTVDGSLNSADVSLVKSKSGTGLP